MIFLRPRCPLWVIFDGFNRGCRQVNDADWIRELAMKKGAWANIPPKSNRSDPICFSPYLYRARNQVDRFFNRIEQCRRVATRYDRLAANHLAFVQLASIRLWLRLNESASLRPTLRYISRTKARNVIRHSLSTKLAGLFRASLWKSAGAYFAGQVAARACGRSRRRLHSARTRPAEVIAAATSGSAVRPSP